jgi:hypothetical protein
MCQTGNNLLYYLDKQKQGEIPWLDISLFQFVEKGNRLSTNERNVGKGHFGE